MKNKRIAILGFGLLLLLPYPMHSQETEGYEVQAEAIDSASAEALHTFYSKLHAWTKTLDEEAPERELAPERRVDNFILFTEDGLIMKDLSLHSVASCKAEIIKSLPAGEKESRERSWIYVSLESQVNKAALVEILRFLQENKITYNFGVEDHFIPQVMKK